MILLYRVTKTYELNKKMTVTAVNDVSMTVKKGEFLIVTGRSGSGKTTLLNLTAGLTRPTSGKVMLDDVEVWKLPDTQQAALRNQKLGFVFQFPSLMPSLNTLENVLLPTAFGSAALRKLANRGEFDKRARELLDLVGLSDKLDSYPRQLSAGQQQRVVIARALINQPELLLADEPTSNLDEQTEQEIMSQFMKIHAEMGITVVLVTHTRELMGYGTRSIHMAEGRIVDEVVDARAASLRGDYSGLSEETRARLTV